MIRFEDVNIFNTHEQIFAVGADITAPLYWWNDFNMLVNDVLEFSDSISHTILEKEFAFDDFSIERVCPNGMDRKMTHCTWFGEPFNPSDIYNAMLPVLNGLRESFIRTGDKNYWYSIMQLLPASYNQKCIVMLDYQDLAIIYKHRLTHELYEWREFCRWIESMPDSEIITCKSKSESQKNPMVRKEIVRAKNKPEE